MRVKIAKTFVGQEFADALFCSLCIKNCSIKYNGLAVAPLVEQISYCLEGRLPQSA